MIDNLSVLFSCTTVIWVVVRLALLDRDRRRKASDSSAKKGA
jgi:hypothetical protein